MEFAITDREFECLRGLVYELTGIKLADQKRQMLRARLSRRLRALNLQTFQEYYEALRFCGPASPEITEFINAVTTNKTDFYREPHHFEFVVNEVLPEIEKREKPGSRSIKIWHAGCSTGEEPYTMAIELHEALKNREPWHVRQLATDIDSCVLAHASRGRYEKEKLSHVPTRLIHKYFLKGKNENENFVQVKPVLADWISFRRLNLLDDPWPLRKKGSFDIIFCRNVMIYFDKPTQQRLVERFREHLTPGGYLLIGHSESLFGIAEGFRCLGKTTYRSECIEAAAA